MHILYAVRERGEGEERKKLEGRLVGRRRLTGAREKWREIRKPRFWGRVIENFVIEPGRRYLYSVPRIIFEAEILEARDTSYVTIKRIALLKTHLHLNGNYPVWLEQRDRPICFFLSLSLFLVREREWLVSHGKRERDFIDFNR